MDRHEWLAERRNSVVAAYDAMAGTYEEYPNEAQQEWVSRLLGTCVPGDVVLDAPCGTGRYFASVVEAGMQVAGYATQAHFLLHGGLDRELADFTSHSSARQVELSGQVKQLTLPTEMGENFKVLGLSRGDVASPSAFRGSDMAHL